MLATRQVLFLSGFLISALAQAQDASDAQQLLRQGKSEQAVQAYTRLIDASPNDPDHWLGRGLAHARLSHWTEAVENLEKAAALAPTYADVWSALADVYRWNDQPAAAADAYGRLASLRTEDPQPQLLRARSLIQAGDLPSARLAADRARALGADEKSLAELDEQLSDKPFRPSTSLQEAIAPELTGNSPASDGKTWALSLGESRTRSAIGDAKERTLSLRRYTKLGSVALEQLSLRRFGIDDVAYAVDAYPRLWSGAYANLRYQKAPSAELYPDDSWRVEIYQSLGRGWELAGSYDELGFESPVRIRGVALARYWGNFYARWRHQQVSSSSSKGNGDRVFIRYYYEGDADHYVEANASRGRSDDFSSVVTQPSRSDSKGLAWYHFVTPAWGVKASWSQSKDSSLAGEDERNVSLGLLFRW